jgi:hypothetical protein
MHVEGETALSTEQQAIWKPPWSNKVGSFWTVFRREKVMAEKCCASRLAF